MKRIEYGDNSIQIRVNQEEKELPQRYYHRLHRLNAKGMARNILSPSRSSSPFPCWPPLELPPREPLHQDQAHWWTSVEKAKPEALLMMDSAELRMLHDIVSERPRTEFSWRYQPKIRPYDTLYNIKLQEISYFIQEDSCKFNTAEEGPLLKIINLSSAAL